MTHGVRGLLRGRIRLSGGRASRSHTGATTAAPAQAVHRVLSAMLAPATAAAAFVAGYLGVLTGAGLRAHRTRHAAEPDDAARHRFLVLVPAHNEEQLIAGTVGSLAALDYPSSHYAVHVVADNCTDATASAAAAVGAHVHERHDPRAPGKGPALSWLQRRLCHEPHDAVAIVDADTVVDRAFLRVMDAHLTRGERAIQGYYAVRDEDGSWLTSLRAAALAVRHLLQPLARTSLGGSAGLRGNGMVLAADLVHGRSWSAHLTEDLEFEARLLLEGERVTFAPDAVVRAEMPARLADAATQNARWERGRIELAGRFTPALVGAAVRRATPNRVACLDAAVQQQLPPMAVLAAATVAGSTTASGLWLLRPTLVGRVHVAVWLAAAAALGTHVGAALHLAGAGTTAWRWIAHVPLYVAWKAGVWARATAASPSAWIRTPRGGERPLQSATTPPSDCRRRT